MSRSRNFLRLTYFSSARPREIHHRTLGTTLDFFVCEIAALHWLEVEVGLFSYSWIFDE